MSKTIQRSLPAAAQAAKAARSQGSRILPKVFQGWGTSKTADGPTTPSTAAKARSKRPSNVAKVWTAAPGARRLASSP